MLKSLFSAVTGLRNHQTMLDVIGNNIANVNTPGFKSSRVLFSDVYYQTLNTASAPTATQGGSNPRQIGYGSTVSSVDVLNTQSGFQQTFRPLDNYISGSGYFVVQDASGARNYTRVGKLQFDSQGNLLDGNGDFIMGATETTAGSGVFDNLTTLAPVKATRTVAGPPAVTYNFSDYTGLAIDKNGVVTGYNTVTKATDTLGQIVLANFPNEDGLSQAGNMNFQETGNSGAPSITTPGSATAGELVGGGLEMSNADLSKEFTDMIIAQRGFQANSRVITTSDEILQELVNLKR